MVIAIVILSAISVISAGLAFYAARSQQIPSPDAGDPDIPLAQEGRQIPVVFGTVDITSPTVVWVGDKQVRDIKE